MNILDYEILLEKLNNMKNLTKHKSINTRLGYNIPYYTYGRGENHIVFVGGTHGSEIISVDFILELMDKISNKKDIFKDINENDYTFHFIPLQNPEGFIVSTSAVRTLIPKNMEIDKVQEICKEYYSKYRDDDIYSKKNPEDKNLKLHQKMFINADYNCISNKHKLLKNSIKNLYKNEKFPKGSIICFRANGSGVELNRNTRYNQGINDIKQNKETYGKDRYNNIRNDIPGPIGVPCLDVDNFEYEPENKFLLKLLNKLSNEKKLCVCFLFHSTGGEIYYQPMFKVYNSKLDQQYQKSIISINTLIAQKYKEFSDYKLAITKDETLCSFDGYLRTLYPGIILIELSKMGGNPIAPYGDIKGNYIPTFENNLKAIYNIITLSSTLKEKIYKKISN